MEGKEPDALILGCVSQKIRGPCRAKDLYVSALFKKRRKYAETTRLPWVIFSAAHGIVEPDTVLSWYDVSMNDLSSSERQALGERAKHQLDTIFLSLGGMAFEIHAGAAYREALEGPLARSGGVLVNPVEGLRFGEQLHWYDRQARA